MMTNMQETEIKESFEAHRNSGLDLLKVVAMVWIVFFHFGSYGLLNSNLPVTGNWFILDFAGLGGGIGNCIFVLISGYFLYTDRFKLKKVLKLFLMVLFYTVINIAIGVIYGSSTIDSLSSLLSLIASFADYWFFDYYIILYVISPLLNRAINKIGKNIHFTIVIIMYIVFNFIPSILLITYSSKIMNMLSVWLTFIELYFVGALIRRNDQEHKVHGGLKAYSTLAVIVVILDMISVYILRVQRSEDCSYFIWKMDRCLPVITAVLLFMCFRTVKVKRKSLVSKLAQTVFAVYLLHVGKSAPFFDEYFLNSKKLYNNRFMIIFMLISTIAIFILSYGAEYIRKIIENRIFCGKQEHRLRGQI